MMWKVDEYSNSIREVQVRGQSGEFFDTEYGALRFMFDRSIKEMGELFDKAKQAHLRHNRLCAKFGARLRELAPKIDLVGDNL
jgi:hypothetical protein